MKNHWNTKLKKKFLAPNTNATGNSTVTPQFSTSTTPQLKVEECVFDYDQNKAESHILCLEQTSIPVPSPLPLGSDVSVIGSSCSAPLSTEVSVPSSSASLVKEENETQWFGYHHINEGEDEAFLLDFVYGNMLHNGFVSQDKST